MSKAADRIRELEHHLRDRIEELRAAYEAACDARDAAAIACSKARSEADAALEVALDAWAKALDAQRALEAAEKEMKND